MRRFAIPAAFVLASMFGLTTSVAAHEDGKTHSHEEHVHEAGAEHSHEGQNGGVVADAGTYHAELVVDGTPNVTVYLSGGDDEPVSTEGIKATAIFLIDGKSQRFALEPADGSRLVGTAPASVKEGVKGVLQLTGPDGKTAQAKF